MVPANCALKGAMSGARAFLLNGDLLVPNDENYAGLWKPIPEFQMSNLLHIIFSEKVIAD